MSQDFEFFNFRPIAKDLGIHKVSLKIVKTSFPLYFSEFSFTIEILDKKKAEEQEELK